MKTSHQLPIHFPPPATLYNSHLFLSAMLPEQAFFSNYIQLKFNPNDDDQRLDYYPHEMEYIGAEGLDAHCIDDRILEIDDELIVEKIIELLNKGFYINMPIPEFLIPGTQLYGQTIQLTDIYAYLHNIFIYGYSNESGVFKILSFDKNKSITELELSYTDFKTAFCSDDMKKAFSYKYDIEKRAQRFEMILYRRSEDEYNTLNINLERIKNQLSYYLEAKNPTSFSCFSSSYEGVSWGLGIYTTLLRNISKDTILFDYKIYYGIYEHKIIMKNRILYLVENKIIPNFTEITALDSLIENCKKLKTLAFKTSITRRHNYRDKMIALLKKIHKQDAALTKKLLNHLNKKNITASEKRIKTDNFLLINAVFSASVGHTIEALITAHAFRIKNPNKKIAVLINSATALDLFKGIENLNILVYPIDLDEFANKGDNAYFESTVPQYWENVFHLKDEYWVDWDDDILRRFYIDLKKWVNAENTLDYKLMYSDYKPAKFPFFQTKPLKFQFSEEIKQFANTFIDNTYSKRIVVLTGSATFQKAPSLDFWTNLFKAISEKWNNVEIILIGVLKKDDHFVKTQNITEDRINEIINMFPNVKNAFDIGILKQLAIAERSDLFIAPHSGMGFALECTGIPWVALSGWKNHEYLTNGEPVWSIFPSCKMYPCRPQSKVGNDIYPECEKIIKEGKIPLPCFGDDELIPKIDEILSVIDNIFNKKISYAMCKERHEALIENPYIFENINQPLYKRILEKLVMTFFLMKNRLTK